ncbi:zinc-binding dehydrogenase [Streptomyces sp. ISL-43]|uniref:zinc-binding dehydrogenase n=1 Tax=Streptomyces sp. ISL-43 TaxID=2819183 RepID=UPI001BE99620|nr:zinc-binding dehydrogenase [Streptomyces sp. ISL-43]MBT2452674.1 zinc-binding dehydrogenase [Streptomyces sp. ISL-43]
MKAFALRRTGEPPTVVDRPAPRPRAGEVLVRTTAALICAWDGHTAAGAPTGLGHEAGGVVEAGPPPGGSVVVFGQGAVGLGATIAAGRLCGARVIAVEPEMKRQRLALRFGADVVIDPAYEDSAERITELTGGAGADRAIMATAAPAAAAAAHEGLAEGGRITYARCRPPQSSGARLARALRLIDGGLVDPTVITTHEFPFHRVEEAFARLVAREPGMIKPVILFPRPTRPAA